MQLWGRPDLRSGGSFLGFSRSLHVSSSSLDPLGSHVVFLVAVSSVSHDPSLFVGSEVPILGGSGEIFIYDGEFPQDAFQILVLCLFCVLCGDNLEVDVIRGGLYDGFTRVVRRLSVGGAPRIWGGGDLDFWNRLLFSSIFISLTSE